MAQQAMGGINMDLNLIYHKTENFRFYNAHPNGKEDLNMNKKLLEEIAQRWMGVEILKTVYVWEIENALREAYETGK